MGKEIETMDDFSLLSTFLCFLIFLPWVFPRYEKIIFMFKEIIALKKFMF